MSNKLFRLPVVFVLICCMLLATIQPSAAFATSVNSSDVILGDGFIKETETAEINGVTYTVERTTYENNSAVMTIIGNDYTKTISLTVNYESLRNFLSQSHLPVTYGDRLEGYEYVYFTTFTQETYLYETAQDLAQLIEDISNALYGANIPPTISIAMVIAAAVLDANGAAQDTRLVTIRNWYIVNQKSTGEFMGYYRCEYQTLVYVDPNKTDDWEYRTTISGSFDGTQVY